jgi:hypothetical protein
VREETLVIAKQPQKLLNEYQVPTAVVADMIRKAMVQIKGVDPCQAGEEGTLFQEDYFAARRHNLKAGVMLVDRLPGLNIYSFHPFSLGQDWLKWEIPVE